MTYTGRTIRDAETSSGETNARQPAGAAEPAVTVAAANPTAKAAGLDGLGVSADVCAARVVWGRELLRFVRNRMRLVASFVQPVLFLLVLGPGSPR
jgi:hypothetical protein